MVVEIKATVKVEGVYEAEKAAELLNLGIATFWRWVKANKIITVRMGNPERVLVPESEIARLRQQIDEKKGSFPGYIKAPDHSPFNPTPVLIKQEVRDNDPRRTRTDPEIHEEHKVLERECGNTSCQ